MKHTTQKHKRTCNCICAELQALEALVDDFAEKMKEKLIIQCESHGYKGWDDPDWSIENIQELLADHIEKGDPVDCANFAAFWWNKMKGKK